MSMPGLEQAVGYTPASLVTEKSGEDRNFKLKFNFKF